MKTKTNTETKKYCKTKTKVKRENNLKTKTTTKTKKIIKTKTKLKLKNKSKRKSHCPTAFHSLTLPCYVMPLPAIDRVDIGKRNVTVWRPSVCHVCPVGIPKVIAFDAVSVHFGPKNWEDRHTSSIAVHVTRRLCFSVVCLFVDWFDCLLHNYLCLLIDRQKRTHDNSSRV